MASRQTPANPDPPMQTMDTVTCGGKPGFNQCIYRFTYLEFNVCFTYHCFSYLSLYCTLLITFTCRQRWPHLWLVGQRAEAAGRQASRQTNTNTHRPTPSSPVQPTDTITCGGKAGTNHKIYQPLLASREGTPWPVEQRAEASGR